MHGACSFTQPLQIRYKVAFLALPICFTANIVSHILRSSYPKYSSKKKRKKLKSSGLENHDRKRLGIHNKPMKQMMIRADDLGYSEGVNYGIEKAVKDGVINNVGFMVNMPATMRGYNLIKDEDISLGLHCNISAGYPLCDPKTIPSLVWEDGHFKGSKDYNHANPDLVDLDDAIKEVEAQLERFREITGKDPDYFEGHAVDSKNFNEALRIVAERNNLLYQPVDLDGGTVNVGKAKIRMCMDSMNPNYNPMEFFKKIEAEQKDDEISLMICHPGYLDEFIINNSSLLRPRPKETEFACSEELKQFIEEQDIDLVQYRNIQK